MATDESNDTAAAEGVRLKRLAKKFSPEEDAIIRRDAARGVRIRATARELDRPYMSVRHRRIKLGVQKVVGDKRQHHVRVTCHKTLYDAVEARAHTLGKSVAAYIRMLLKRDLGVDD